MITVGLDLSLVESGLVILNGDKIIKQETIKSKPNGDTPQDELKRLLDIKNKIIIELPNKMIDLFVIEGLAFSARNTRSLVQLAGLNYLIREYIDSNRADSSWVIIQPTTLKKHITGKGNSPKDGMLLETYKRYGISFSNNNLCDAFGLAKIGMALLNNKTKLTVPQSEVISLIKKQL